MMEYYREGYIKYDSGMEVRYWLSKKSRRNNAVIIHGLGERLEMYEYMYRFFDRAGISLNAIELRGHGMSGGKRKYIDDFALYVEDLRKFINEHLHNKTVFLIGHSTGALVSLRLIQSGDVDVKGLLLTSPLIEMKNSMIKQFITLILSRLMPHFVLHDNEESYDQLTHDQKYVEAMIKENRRTLFGITIGFLGAFFRERKKFMKETHLLKNTPLLLFVPGSDFLLDLDKLLKLLNNIYKKNLKKLEIVHCSDCYHSIFFENSRNKVVNKMIECIKENK